MTAVSAVSSLLAPTSEQGEAVEAAHFPEHAPSLLLATDACCQAGHVIAEVERDGGEMPVVLCVTCTERWGHKEGLRSWQEHCPDGFAEAYPRGLTDRDLGITARPVV